MIFGLKNKLVFDRFTKRFLIKGFLPWDFVKLQEVREWTDEDEDCLVNYIERNYKGIRVPAIIKSTLSELKLKKSTNVVTDYFNSLKWDGIPRIDTLLIDYFGTEDTIYSREIIRKELVAAVRRVVTEKTIKFDEMIILVGTQGQGKSTFFSKLGKSWYTDIKLKLDDKDTLVSLQKYMIVEVGELDGFNKLEVSALKSFLSKVTDTYRAPYAQNAVEHPRHYVLFGTTNEDEFLRDSTGERRFWPIDCFEEKATKSVFTELSEDDVDQIWAEAVYLNDKGESLLLSKEARELAKIHQGLHKVHNPKEGEIKEFINKKVTKNWLKETDFSSHDAGTSSSNDLVDKDRVCAAIIWCECFGNRNTGNMKISDSKEINSILSTLKFEDRKLVSYYGKFGKYGVQRGFKIIKS